jgi:YfiH family protein
MNKYRNIQGTVRQYGSSHGILCRYGFFNRHGGTGTAPFNSMNVSYGVGDEKKTVSANRQRIGEIIPFSILLSAKQVHGDGIYSLPEPVIGTREIEGVDALITDQQGIGLMIQQADCQAVLLFDPVQKVIAAVHCGWRGSVINILSKVVRRMKSQFGVAPENLLAAISPSLGPCCAEFVNYREELPVEFKPFMVQQDYFDFWQISKCQLTGVGVRESKIAVAGSCTCCSKDYFSYRRSSRSSNGVTGRNCSVIGMVG